jgi:WD40 repeat protein
LAQQFLFSCSDDGTVRLYDFTPISGWGPKPSEGVIQAARSSEEEALRIRRSQR